ncbi:LysR family transcriptional regulator [Streptomyces sp. LP05-1]|uniref:LysR family transcriptional regulator n=1 Tax=Streptomyces pyxinae TaxID=2970734 RepID=A0ABT2CD22_9ACTN|nr:LysR family transcriptional regulator [Streptomyces sp. LP05-1]MCS0635298.1 LysR family transcriptional regulator [Streptomyces sp. LP05-1]
MELELRHLRILLAIAEAGSLSRAAAALMLSQPAMSTQLRRIEASFGRPLFERTARGVVPTRTGELVLAHARDAVASAERIRNCRSSPGTGHEPVTFGGTPGPLLGQLTLHLPGALSNPVHFTQFSSTGEALAAAADRSVDAVCLVDMDGFGAVPPDGVYLDVIGVEPVAVMLPAGHRLAGPESADRTGGADRIDGADGIDGADRIDRTEGGERADRTGCVELAELAGETWLLPPDDPGCDDYGALVDACAAAGFVPRVSPHRLQDVGLLCDLIAQGMGITVAQGSARPREGVALRRLTGDPMRARHVLVVHRDSPLAPARPLLTRLAEDAFRARCLSAGRQPSR